MNHYQHSLVIDASPAAVYAALTTPEGLRGWWTPDCDVATQMGDTIHFRFGSTHKDMRIEQLQPGREVRWLCTRAHIAAGALTRKDEWMGTHIVFRLVSEGDRTRLDFEHVGLVPAFECYDLCRRGWDYFLSSLQRFVETGRGTPFELQSAVACQAAAA
jgi:uncharacterized protein YndB with AHSA1/START domain